MISRKAAAQGWSCPKALLSAWLAFPIVIVHVLGIVLIYLAVPDAQKDSLEVEKIMAPATAAYAVGVIKWIIQEKGFIPPQPTIGLTYVAMSLLVCGGFLIGLVAGLIGLVFELEFMRSYASANTYFSVVETAFGTMFALFYNDLFGTPD